MRAAIIIVTFLLLSSESLAQVATFDWAFSMGSPTFDKGSDVVSDGNGNVYVTGKTSGSIDFDPGPDTVLVPAGVGFNSSFFIQKLDSDGNLLWAHAMGNGYWQAGEAVAVTPDGGVLIGGTFTSVVDFDPGPDSVIVTWGGGTNDAFILKLDADGIFEWVGAISGEEDILLNDLTLDPDGNILITGSFEGSADFDPSSNQHQLESNGWVDIYLAKWDQDGNFIWATSAGGWHVDHGYSVCTDAVGNVFVTGDYSYHADFDASAGIDTVTSISSSDVFIQKLNSNGEHQWVRSIGGHNGDLGTSIITDQNGDVIISGKFAGVTDFDPGPEVFELDPNGQWNGFLQKLTTDGAFIWAKAFFGDMAGQLTDLSLDQNNNIYAAGGFEGTVDLDPGPATLEAVSTGQTDSYFMKLTGNGELLWALPYGGESHDIASAIAIDFEGSIYQTGMFFGTMDFDPGPGVELDSSQTPNIYVTKLRQENFLSAGEGMRNSELSVYPNPSTGFFTVATEQSTDYNELVISDLHGTVVHSFQMNHGTEVVYLELPSGCYFLRPRDSLASPVKLMIQ